MSWFFRNHIPRIEQSNSFVGGVKILKASFNDSNDVAFPKQSLPRGFKLIGAGTLKVDTVDGSTMTYADGEWALNVIHPGGFVRIYDTGSTVTEIDLYW